MQARLAACQSVTACQRRETGEPATILPAAILNLLVALGIGIFGALCLFGPDPNRHHREIMKWRDLTIDGNMIATLVPLYRIAGGALLSAAAGLAGLGLVAQTQGAQWAFAILLVMVLLCGVPAVSVARSTEVA